MECIGHRRTGEGILFFLDSLKVKGSGGRRRLHSRHSHQGNWLVVTKSLIKCPCPCDDEWALHSAFSQLFSIFSVTWC